MTVAKRKTRPDVVAKQIRRLLREGGSIDHAKRVQWFFKEEIKSHGWYTAALRKTAVQFRRSISREHGMNFVIQVANDLFSGRNLEEKVIDYFLQEPPDAQVNAPLLQEIFPLQVRPCTQCQQL
jgi:hypothetical protein